MVPTMGSLHTGHFTLVQQARSECDVLVVSIFVNPTQFNDPGDFEKYPREVESDLKKLEQTGCDFVFLPSKEEIYPEPDKTNYQFGILDSIGEGAHRPGHFRGVAMVVRRFFDIVRPDKAYFGLKDYQQVAVIRKLVEQYALGVEIVAVDTVREPDGLALSSRNQLLSKKFRKQAPEIYRTLKTARARYADFTPDSLSQWAKHNIENSTDLELEYFTVADPDSLEPITRFDEAEGAIALIAVRAGTVRLIDNIKLF